MRIVVALACLALLAGCGDDEEQAATTATFADLAVTVDPDGTGAKKPRRAVVECATADDSKACRAVAALKAKAFAPTPHGIACTEQYGGPQVATVKGTLRSEAIDAKFSRVNGCEISRWNRVADLLEAAA